MCFRKERSSIYLSVKTPKADSNKHKTYSLLISAYAAIATAAPWLLDAVAVPCAVAVAVADAAIPCEHADSRYSGWWRLLNRKPSRFSPLLCFVQGGRVGPLGGGCAC